MSMWEFIYKTKGKRPVERNVFIESEADRPPLTLFMQSFKDADLSTVEFKVLQEVVEECQ